MATSSGEKTVFFEFPAGHPREGQSVVLHGVEFKNGKAEVPQTSAAEIGLVLTPWHRAAVRGTAEWDEVEAEYAPHAAAKESDARAASAPSEAEALADALDDAQSEIERLRAELAAARQVNAPASTAAPAAPAAPAAETSTASAPAPDASSSKKAK